MRTEKQNGIVTVLIGGTLLGAIVGVGSLATTPEGRSAVAARTTALAVKTGFKRAREPQAGDWWGGCNDARRAGTEPIYRGEPGYRPEMDGDDDGIACEPYTG